MSEPHARLAGRPVVAFGPDMPGWGSWEWVGVDLAGELAKYYQTFTYPLGAAPACDVAVVVKQAPAPEWVELVSRRAAVIYCPVDFYGGAADIDADGGMLRRCARVVVHCERLRRYFEPYAPVEYLDHHVKFLSPTRQLFGAGGTLLWVGVRTNLPPLVEWLNAHALPEELCVLTNPEDPAAVPTAADLGVRPQPRGVLVEAWTAERHRWRLAHARGALDIKGEDFRARHKPPAKALDFIAAGVPLAMNLDSSPVEHLARMGFEVASPLDLNRWLSREYWEETQRFGGALRELLSLERVGRRFRHIIDEVLAARQRG